MRSRTYSYYVKLLNEMLRRGEVFRKLKVRTNKELVVKELCELIPKYRTICLIDLSNTPTPQFKELKRVFSDYGVIKVVKNNLLIKALNNLKLKNYEEVTKNLSGSNCVFLTNLNAFEVAALCRKFKSKKFAKPGDIVLSEVVIPSGPTNIPPGPSLSVFGKLRIPTQVREGFIWVVKDVTVAKPGDKISNELASLLRKLGIKAVDVGFKVKMVYDGGLIFTKADELELDVESFREDMLNSVRAAVSLAIEAVIPVPEVLPALLSKAYLNALTISAETGMLTSETIQLTLGRAISKAAALASVIGAKVPELGITTALAVTQPLSPDTGKPPQRDKEVSDTGGEEKKEVSEEELSEGLSSLFG